MDARDWDGRERRSSLNEHWHVGKEVPLAMLVMLLIQTSGGVWWASSISNDVNYIKDTLKIYANERYTREDARRDKEILLQIVEGLRQRDVESARRLDNVENVLNGIESLHPGFKRK